MSHAATSLLRRCFDPSAPPQLLEELVQKRDNARGLPRLDSLKCLKQAPRPRSCTEIAPHLPHSSISSRCCRLTRAQLLADDSPQMSSHALWVLGTASRHEPDVQVQRARLQRHPAPGVLVRLKRFIQLRMSELGVVDILSSLLPSALASAPASPASSGPRIAAKLL
jgi:hypothetical protein